MTTPDITWNGVLCFALLWTIQNAVGYVATAEAGIIAGIALLGLFIGDTETRIDTIEQESNAGDEADRRQGGRP